MKVKNLVTACMVGLSSLPLFGGEKVDNIGDFFSKGTYDVKMRLAYENSDVDNGTEEGEGLVLSSYVGYRTAEIAGVSLYAQYHNMLKISDDFRDSEGKHAGEHDFIADEDGQRIQQLYLDLKVLPDTLIRIGRQEILLDDVRFIGNIGWRNTAQAFDAVTLTNKSIKDTTIFLGYSENVASIWFDENEYDGIYLANVKYAGIEGHTQTAFAYLVDRDENEPNAGPSIKNDRVTVGARLTGSFDALGYDVQYANQTDWEDSDDIDLNFFQANLSYKMGALTPAIGYAYHEGDGTTGFSNLFSTAHKFNGWTDQFLGTNTGGLANGLQDYNASVTYKSEDLGMTFKAVYHFFDTTNDGAYDDEYGEEFNFLAVKPINENLTLTAKFAIYEAEENASNPIGNDEQVFWLRLDYKIGGKVADLF